VCYAHHACMCACLFASIPHASQHNIRASTPCVLPALQWSDHAPVRLQLVGLPLSTGLTGQKWPPCPGSSRLMKRFLIGPGIASFFKPSTAAADAKSLAGSRTASERAATTGAVATEGATHVTKIVAPATAQPNSSNPQGAKRRLREDRPEMDNLAQGVSVIAPAMLSEHISASQSFPQATSCAPASFARQAACNQICPVHGGAHAPASSHGGAHAPAGLQDASGGGGCDGGSGSRGDLHAHSTVPVSNDATASVTGTVQGGGGQARSSPHALTVLGDAVQLAIGEPVAADTSAKSQSKRLKAPPSSGIARYFQQR
jgi:hypothetical protein